MRAELAESRVDPNQDYHSFLDRKSQSDTFAGFEPLWVPDFLFDFQKSLLDWSVRKGKSAVFADCGLGKTPMQLAWAENIVRKTNRPVLVLTPLAVSQQTVREGEKFGIDVKRSAGGSPNCAHIVVTNYEKLHHFDSSDFAGVVCDESSAIKHFSGERQMAVTEFMRMIQYRLLCTATAADICGSCRFLASYQYVRTYYKCRKRGDTSSAATDHRVGWRACALFEAKPC